MTVDFVDPRTTPFTDLRTRGELPHLYKEGGSYFVTFRVHDAVDIKRGKSTSEAPKTGKTAASPLQVAQAIVRRSDPPLRLGSCILARPEIADVTQNALMYFDEDRYKLSAWCIMPNHIHTVVTPLGKWQPSSILHSWKSFTSHRANEILKRRGSIWERESFDHLIRSVEHFEAFIYSVRRGESRLGGPMPSSGGLALE